MYRLDANVTASSPVDEEDVFDADQQGDRGACKPTDNNKNDVKE
jgi:hypothetical protein